MDIKELEKSAQDQVGDVTLTFTASELAAIMTGLYTTLADAPDEEKDHPLLKASKAAGRKIIASVDRGPFPYNFFDED